MTQVSAAQVGLSWSAPTGPIDHYRVERGERVTGAFTSIADTQTTSFIDTTVVAGTAYLYRVRAVAPGGDFSPPSNLALAAAVSFTDDPLVANVTEVKALHIAELRQAVNAVRRASNLSNAAWTDPTLTQQVTLIKAAHVQELRDKLNEALAALGVPSSTFTDPVLGVGTTPLRKIHIGELRQRSSRGASSNSGGMLVALTSPANNTAFGDGSNVQLSANVSGGSAAKVEFFQGQTKLGEDATAPYSLVWASAPEGSHSLTAVATDSFGATTTSPPVNIGVVNFTAARLDPSNRVGGGGVDMVSRNYSWSLPVVGLPGRSGLDLGLSLSYNSLVWTKSGSFVLFDGDWGAPAPGFRFGFPFVQQKFYNAQASKFSYLLLTPSGDRVELRQTSTANIYEASDSSYLQLSENADGSLTLRTTDGTQMSYWYIGGTFRCAQVKDRNGNFINVGHDVYGNVESVTDTVGRVLTFNYEGAYLQSVTQTWQRETSGGTTVTETRNWARFYYEDKPIQTNFAGLTMLGAQNGQTFHALTRLKLPDDSSYTFNYTTWGQVNQIAHYAADNHLLNYVSYNLPADGSQPQTDCPRFTERRVWAEHWNGDVNGAPAAGEEAPVVYSAFNFASGVAHATTPDGTRHQESYETSGWKKGLTTRTDTFSPDDLSSPKKWTTVEWTQDDTSLAFALNPRVEETHTHDSQGNHRRVRLAYTSFGLPQDVFEYDGDATTVLRRMHVEYLQASVTVGGTYTNRRIIGLPAERSLYGRVGGQERLASKVTFEYDLAGEFLVSAGSPTHHDSSGYGDGFVVRGNACRLKRWDVNDPANASKAVKSETGYNTTGSVIFSRDALDHKTSISYTDSNGGNTLAYATKVTDADNFFSTLEYNYGLGLVTRAVNPKGAARKTLYDARGRVEKVSSEVNGAYTRWEYPASARYVRQFTTVDVGMDETSSVSVFDGAGHVRATLRKLPVHYAGQRFAYDSMERRVKLSNPMEVSVNENDLANVDGWQPAGDDAQAGWNWTTQTFDWKGRPLVTTLPKLNPGDQNEQPTTREAEYGGCGCAGGEVVTLKGELVPTFETSTSVERRTQKVYHDALGRAVKVEVLNWNGSVYSTTTTEHNALDQAVRVRQYAGAAPGQEPEGEGSGYQTTVMTYDGYARLKTRKYPHESSPTTFNYKSDDLVESVTDARGVDNTFSYNNRHLLTGVDYGTAPGVEPTADVTLAYDESGSRTQMVEAGLGQVDYVYNTLSQLTSETRQFAGLSGTFPLTYTYNLAGQLKSVTDSANATTSYNYDSQGRVHSVTASGTTYGGVTTYASAIKYRAWGALRSLTYGNNMWLATDYDERMRISRFEVGGQSTQYGGPSTTMLAQYSYYADGSPRLVDNGVNDIFDRAFSYDHALRLQEAYSGNEARNFVNNTSGGTADGPYRQTYQHDAWDNITGRTNRFWSRTDTLSANYTNNRRQGFGYDEAGNLLSDGLLLYSYDAAGQNRLVHDNSTIWVTQWHDGDGQPVKRHEERHDATGQPAGTITTFYLRSSVLGGRVVSELSAAGEKQSGKVYMGVELLAEQTAVGVEWKHQDPVTGSDGSSVSGAFFSAGVESDPTGVDVGPYDPFLFQAPPVEPGVPSLLGGFIFPSGRCTWNGLPLFCSEVPRLAGSETAVLAPQETARQVIYQGRLVMALWQAYADGYQGFVPMTASYVGGGIFRPNGGGGPPTLARRNRVSDTNFSALNGVWDNSETHLSRPQSSALADRAARNSSFNFGNIPFTQDRQKILTDSNFRINQDDCKKFINDTLAKYKVGQDVNSLAKLLEKSKLSFYDISTFLGGADYSPSDLGLDAHGTLEVRGAFLAGASAVTYGERIFLSEKVFSRPLSNSVPVPGYNRYADTSTYIVHELFHVAGIPKSVVDSQSLTDAIRANCRLIGSDPIILKH